MTKFRPKPAYFETKNQICPNNIPFKRELSDPSVRLLIAINAIYTCTKNWVVCQQDLQNRMGWGELKMRNAIKNCVECGYLKVTQNRNKKGKFKINEFEFDLGGGYLKTYEQKTDQNKKAKTPHNEYQPGGGLRSTDWSGTSNQAIPRTNDLTILKETTTEVAAVLLNLEIQETEKVWISKTYDLETIQNAVFLATHPTTKIKKSLIATIKWACKGKYKFELPKLEQDSIAKKVKENVDEKIMEKNKEFASKIISENRHLFTDNWNLKTSEFCVYLTTARGGHVIDYLDPDFENILSYLLETLKSA